MNKLRKKFKQETIRTICAVIAVSIQVVIAAHLLGGAIA